jgi:hypothetical protein
MKRQVSILLTAVAAAGILAAAPAIGASPGNSRGAEPAPVSCATNERPVVVCVLKDEDVVLSVKAHVLRLRVPRMYVAMQVTCRKNAQELVTCTVRPVRVGMDSGTRVLAITVPPEWTRLLINCAAPPATRGMACRTVKRAGVATIGG